MRAFIVSSISADYSGCGIGDVALPSPSPDQALVRVYATSLNFPDLLLTRGQYQLKPPLPFSPGIDVAGEIVDVGAGCSFRPGDKVVGSLRIGGFAEYVAIDTQALRRIPPTMDYAHAAAFGAAYLTAYVGLVACGALQPTQWVLVHGAAGGVGLAAVDLAKALGARVIAGSASAEKLAVVAAEYAPSATVLTASGFRDAIRDLCGGADLIFDPVGGNVFDESTRCLAFGGRLLVVGFASGRIPKIAVNVPLLKGFSVVGVRAGEYCRRFPDRGSRILDTLWQMAGEGRLRPRVHQIYPLEHWRTAFAAMETRQVIGKIVLCP